MFFGCKNLSFSYYEKKVLTNINLDVKKGEFIGLVGSNGSGKSTLLKLLCGILSPQEGEVIIKDQKLDESNRMNVGYIFQNPENQIIGVTVEEDVAFGLENIGVPREKMLEKIEWALSTVGLEGLNHADPNALSGGQKQRLAIASILAMEPEIILMDEPTSMLDPKGRNEIYKVIHNLREIGETIIIASHHSSDLEYVDKIIALNDGEIVYEGEKDQFYKNKVIQSELPFNEKIKRVFNTDLKKLVDEICR
ncbi:MULTISPECIES: energy-coupling factor ABC transporter ATP-binding protein [Petrotoga]|uniref:Energy-coupling factor transport system ATP-binding protein n=2 Tax=Petrotoga sibirica TaxID=156202 RepID=A0A4R8EVB6_9BACT|nr:MULTISPECIES: ATP-binding cassette domain-containing protein [Petrotoga]KUK83447.1 MAG: ABC transporter related [Petrotoga mobilis]POZ88210.1 ABC transporter [Petrotoga sibirica DSM 13575]POZ90325.1 ABC transporter [Petrotoga sp. SL27]TDX16389.1 energy-coupling factor transport system ATP-binding protein [Petrotoga sibirica]